MRKVDWNINDFSLAESISHMADYFINKLKSLNNTVDEFETLFPNVADKKAALLSFSGKTTENNYIEKVEYLLNNNDQFSGAIQTIQIAQKFIKKNLPGSAIGGKNGAGRGTRQKAGKRPPKIIQTNCEQTKNKRGKDRVFLK